MQQIFEWKNYTKSKIAKVKKKKMERKEERKPKRRKGMLSREKKANTFSGPLRSWEVVRDKNMVLSSIWFGTVYLCSYIWWVTEHISFTFKKVLAWNYPWKVSSYKALQNFGTETELIPGSLSVLLSALYSCWELWYHYVLAPSFSSGF